MQAIRTRRPEDRQALKLAGREGDWLGVVDNIYQARDIATDSVIINREIAMRLDGISCCYIPAISSHPDHITTKQACLSLPVPKRLYAESVHANQWGWPDWVLNKSASNTQNIDFWWQQKIGHLVPDFHNQAEVVHLDENQRAAKLAALEYYSSQMPGLNRGVDAIRPPYGSSVEVFWDLP